MNAVTQSAERLRSAIQNASAGLVQRRTLVELVVLAAVAGEHVLVVGPPGTAKSQAARAIAGQLGGSYFEYLVGRFTEPSELFGPIDLQRLREGVIETRTDGMLPEAEIAFLDEVFRGSTAILNTLLGILNERRFRRGSSTITCPLRVCIGATNEVPDDETLAAFADRFLVQLFVESVPDALLEDLLEAGWGLDGASRTVAAAVGDLDAVADAARAVDMSTIRTALADSVRILRNKGILLSDRRIVRSQKLVAAAAALDGRSVAGVQDLWPMLYAVPGSDEQGRAREALRDHLAETENAALAAAAEDASAGPRVRAARLIEQAQTLLESPDPSDSVRLRLEAVAREIDSSIAPDAAPEALADVRSVLARRLSEET